MSYLGVTRKFHLKTSHIKKSYIKVREVQNIQAKNSRALTHTKIWKRHRKKSSKPTHLLRCCPNRPRNIKLDSVHSKPRVNSGLVWWLFPHIDQRALWSRLSHVKTCSVLAAMATSNLLPESWKLPHHWGYAASISARAFQGVRATLARTFRQPKRETIRILTVRIEQKSTSMSGRELIVDYFSISYK